MFNEENTVEQVILDTLGLPIKDVSVIESGKTYASVPGKWQYMPAEQLPRQHSDVLIDGMVRNALIRLNPEIKAQPDLADEVLYKLRAILLSVQGTGLVRANELFTEWLRGEKTMPFGENNEHTTVQLIDFENPSNNDYLITNQ